MISTFSPFIQLLLKSLKEHLGTFFEACERVGEFTSRNISIQDLPILAQWPKGQYKVELKTFDEIDDNIVNATLFMTILN